MRRIKWARAIALAAVVAVGGAACSLFLSGTGRVRVLNGSGAYRAISGTLTVTGMYGEIARQVHGGQCDHSPTATPQASYTALFGGGKVTFG